MEIMWGGPYLIKVSPWKELDLLERGDLKHERVSCWLWRSKEPWFELCMETARWQGTVYGLWLLRAIPGWQLAEKQWPQSYNHKKMSSVNLSELGIRALSCRYCKWECSWLMSWLQLCETLSRRPSWPVPDSWPMKPVR